jgi:hypothetical protein
MSKDANDFIDSVLALGVKLKPSKSEEGFDGSDYDTISSDDPFVIDAKSVKMFRDSEHYFTVSIRLKNNNLLHISAPINKISMTDRKDPMGLRS